MAAGGEALLDGTGAVIDALGSGFIVRYAAVVVTAAEPATPG